MKKVVLCVALAGLFFLGSGVAFAGPFVNAPEDTLPGWWLTREGASGGPTWSDNDYQRNIKWDFSNDPDDPTGPTPSPDAEYQGEFDDALQYSDTFRYDADMNWVQPGTTQGFGEDGYLEINGGTGGVQADIVNHLDNFPIQRPEKHVYLEALFLFSGSFLSNVGGPIDPFATGWLTISLFSDLGFPGEGPMNVVLPNTTNLLLPGLNYFWELIGTPGGDEIARLNMWWEIEPNPNWEEIYFFFDIPENQYILIDEMHVATECVPVPGVVLLFGSGLLGLIGYRRKM